MTEMELGHGAYGRVFEVKYCGMVCATKGIQTILIEEVDDMKILLDVLEEYNRMWQPNFLKFVDVYFSLMATSEPVLDVVMMENCLTMPMDKCKNISFYMKFSFLFDISRGLWYLHRHNPHIIHRDLSPNNVLLTAHNVAKISDLEVTKADCRKAVTTAPATVGFIPPESLYHSPVNSPMDMFSFAEIILSQEWPMSTDQVKFYPKTRKMVTLSEVEQRQQYPERLTGEAALLRPLVKKCLEDYPGTRPSASTIYEKIKVITKDSPQDDITLYMHSELPRSENHLKPKWDLLLEFQKEPMSFARSVPTRQCDSVSTKVETKAAQAITNSNSTKLIKKRQFTILEEKLEQIERELKAIKECPQVSKKSLNEVGSVMETLTSLVKSLQHDDGAYKKNAPSDTSEAQCDDIIVQSVIVDDNVEGSKYSTVFPHKDQLQLKEDDILDEDKIKVQLQHNSEREFKQFKETTPKVSQQVNKAFKENLLTVSCKCNAENHVQKCEGTIWVKIEVHPIEMDIRFVAEFENHTATTSWDKVVQADCLNRDKMNCQCYRLTQLISCYNIDQDSWCQWQLLDSNVGEPNCIEINYPGCFSTWNVVAGLQWKTINKSTRLKLISLLREKRITPEEFLKLAVNPWNLENQLEKELRQRVQQLEASLQNKGQKNVQLKKNEEMLSKFLKYSEAMQGKFSEICEQHQNSQDWKQQYEELEKQLKLESETKRDLEKMYAKVIEHNELLTTSLNLCHEVLGSKLSTKVQQEAVANYFTCYS